MSRAACIGIAWLLLSTGAPAQSGPPLSGPALDVSTNEVAALLRCPVCQGLSVADSPSSMARNMKIQVREKLAAGYDKDEILADFERSYGEFVRLEPTTRGVNWLVWAGPVAALLIGGLMVARTLKRSRGPPARDAVGGAETARVPSRDALPDDRRLAAAVLRIRELAYGWPGGIAPHPPVSRP